MVIFFTTMLDCHRASNVLISSYVICFWTSWMIICPDGWLWFGSVLILHSTTAKYRSISSFLFLPDLWNTIYISLSKLNLLTKYRYILPSGFLGFPQFEDFYFWSLEIRAASSESSFISVNFITNSLKRQPWIHADSKENYPKKKPYFSLVNYKVLR